MSRKTSQDRFAGVPFSLVVFIAALVLSIGPLAGETDLTANENFEGGLVCEEGPFPECMGVCPPDMICVPGANVCICEPAPPCEQAFPECNGICPQGEVCRDDGTGGGCICEREPCEAGVYPECAGECPPDMFCALDDAAEACYCAPLPCEALPYPQCFGECPPGTACEPLDAAAVCR